MIKKVKRIFVNFHEWIFKRKELSRLAVSEHLLKKEVEEKAKLIEEGVKLIEESDRIMKMLYSGDIVRLTHHEKAMILNAINHKPFRETIELPATKAQTRIIWRYLRIKIKLHLKAKDDETKAGDNG